MVKPNDLGQVLLLTGIGRGGLFCGLLDDAVELGLDDRTDRLTREDVDRPGMIPL